VACAPDAQPEKERHTEQRSQRQPFASTDDNLIVVQVIGDDAAAGRDQAAEQDEGKPSQRACDSRSPFA